MTNSTFNPTGADDGSVNVYVCMYVCVCMCVCNQDELLMVVIRKWSWR